MGLNSKEFREGWGLVVDEGLNVGLLIQTLYNLFEFTCPHCGLSHSVIGQPIVRV